MKICVLQPDYSTSAVDYQYYDPARNLTALYPEATVDHVLLNKLTTYRQLRDLSKKGYDIFVNLCEGYLEWEVPSIDVIHTLELLNLPFTGPSSNLYDPPKPLMKYVAFCEGVRTPAYVLVQHTDDLKGINNQLTYPLFVKPSKAGDSLGIDEHSMVTEEKELRQKVEELLPEYGELLVEEYIAGREFTVLVAANAHPEQTCTVFKPVEYVFPPNRAFKTYALKTSELHPDCNVPCNDTVLEIELKMAAERIFNAFNGVGYARLDFRVNDRNEIYFLEINFTCSVFYSDGYEGSADFILKYDGIGQSGFLHHMVAEGIARHKRRQKKFRIKGNSIAGYGIYATEEIPAGEIIFKGEERAQRIVTRRHVEKHWPEEMKEHFRRYAYPISTEVYILWDDDPLQWAPQNHSCDPNTSYDGLNVLTRRPIGKGEELTLDYATLLDRTAEPFECRCGSANCRGVIKGIAGNSVTKRERGKRLTAISRQPESKEKVVRVGRRTEDR
ncbi:MAG: SET domain-containing protein-lysine N-methyltransferase [Chitinophagales bacterium]|nr:SET domain-containing protein-lysine N-methyltransferase [Chitinophagales bacterium]